MYLEELLLAQGRHPPKVLVIRQPWGGIRGYSGTSVLYHLPLEITKCLRKQIHISLFNPAGNRNLTTDKTTDCVCVCVCVCVCLWMCFLSKWPYSQPFAV